MTFRFLQISLLALLLAVTAPLRADDSICALDNAQDQVLQQRLLRVLEYQGLGPAVREGDLAVSLLVLTDPARPRLAQVNGDHMIYAASLPKIAILLGAAVEIEKGRLQLTPSLEQDIHDMIRYSCNECSNRVLQRVGRENLLNILQSPRYSLYDADHGGGLWLGKDYGPTRAYHRDPLANLSHGATTFQVARFYCGLRKGNLVSPKQAQLMRSALSEPGIQHKFVKGLAGHDELEMYRKSGTWRDFHADSALVETENEAYVMVALAHSARGAAWLQHLAEPLHILATTSQPSKPTLKPILASAPAQAASR